MFCLWDYQTNNRSRIVQILELKILIQSFSVMQARLAKEQAELSSNNYIVIAEQANLWTIVIQGPQTSPFEGGAFTLEFKLDNFPFKGPAVGFRTKIFHPNVSEKGEICPEMLEITDKWAPTKKLAGVIEKIKTLMLAPNLDTPMNQDAATSYKNGQWQQTAKAWTQQYAK